jgi:hypothetical protein
MSIGDQSGDLSAGAWLKQALGQRNLRNFING